MVVEPKTLNEGNQHSFPLAFFGLEIEEAESLVGSLAGKAYHGRSFVNFIYKHHKTSLDQMLSISKEVRENLKNLVDFSPLVIKRRLISKDGTIKFLFEIQTTKGPQEIESVYIPDDERVTLCVSSQVGCKMACQFCLTAQLGFKDSLTAAQIVAQVYSVNIDPQTRPITNVVFMGMGEPFDNIDEVRRATRILTHPRGLNLSARKVTVSTVGLVDKIDSLTKDDPFRLAVSLNSSTDELRSRLMPVNRRWPLKELMRACHDYSQRTNKWITFEYILMAGLTDQPEDSSRLISLIGPLRCKLNLIPYNESEFTEFKRPSEQAVLNFHQMMLKAEVPVFIRKNRGNDIFAACGMLRRVQSISLN